MMRPSVENLLSSEKSTWVVTGAAGFIGSHLTEALLLNGQTVVGLDNFLSGKRENLESIRRRVGDYWSSFRFIEGDIRDSSAVEQALRGARYVLHQAALASVAESIRNPALATDINIGGFSRLLEASVKLGIQRMVFASSAAVYGSNQNLPLKEPAAGQPLSVYALTKQVNEQFANLFSRTHGLDYVALRYFNVYGPRQDPQSPYSGVLSIFLDRISRGDQVSIFGDGQSTRDFCHVKDVVWANISAALSKDEAAKNRAFNIGTGEQTSILELFQTVKSLFLERNPAATVCPLVFQDPRPGDIRHSQADISLAKEHLAFQPKFALREGIADLFTWMN